MFKKSEPILLVKKAANFIPYTSNFIISRLDIFLKCL